MRDGKVVIAFDAGGVLTRFPHKFRPLVNTLASCRHLEVLVLSDQQDSVKLHETLTRNGFHFWLAQVHAADYEQYGEECKAVKCLELGVDFLIDDFPGYCAARNPGNDHVSLFVWPQPHMDYYASDFITDGSEGNFGRRRSRRNPMKDPRGMVKDHQAGVVLLSKYLEACKVELKNLLQYTDEDTSPALACARTQALLTLKEIEDGTAAGPV